MSFPITPLVHDEIVTGSIKPIAYASPLAPELSEEDWRRAKSALGVAVDPVGNGSRMVWDNPESGLRGSFTPEGKPFVKAGDVCRVFTARIKHASNAFPEKQLHGTACRVAEQEWELSGIKPGAAAGTDGAAKQKTSDG